MINCTLTWEAKNQGMLDGVDVIEVQADGSLAIVKWQDDGGLGIMSLDDEGCVTIEWDLPN
jgi:hypothetical protein